MYVCKHTQTHTQTHTHTHTHTHIILNCQAAVPASVDICGVDEYNGNGCGMSLGPQRPNALRVHFKGTPDWATTATNKKNLGFYYRAQLSLTENFATVAATQNIVLQTEDIDESSVRYEGVLFENLSAGNTYFFRVAAFSYFLGDWKTTTLGTMVLGAPGVPGIATSTGIFEGPYIEVCVRKRDLL
jgi:hypothetical protein